MLTSNRPSPHHLESVDLLFENDKHLIPKLVTLEYNKRVQTAGKVTIERKMSSSSSVQYYDCTEDAGALPLELQTLIQTLIEKRAAAAQVIQGWTRQMLAARKDKQARLVTQILSVRKAAACHLQSHMKGWLVRKDTPFLRSQSVAFRIKAPHPVFVSSCSNPPWKQMLTLVYSKLADRYYVQFQGHHVQSGTHSYRIFTGGRLAMEGYLRISEKGKTTLLPINKFSSSVGKSLNSFSSSYKFCSEAQIKALSRSQGSLVDFPLRSVSNQKSLRLSMRSFKAAQPEYARQELTSKKSSDSAFIHGATQSFGIADGVGSWKSLGLNPGALAKELMKYASAELTKSYETLFDNKSKDAGNYLKDVLRTAYDQVKSFGSSTALLATCFRSNLIAVNLGDSSVMVLRCDSQDKLKIVFRTKEMQHAFNCPYQLSHLPLTKHYPEMTRKGYGSLVKYLQNVKNQVKDTPEVADVYHIPLEVNDIIIAGSDGLFDNLFETTIVEHAETARKIYSNNLDLCSKLAERLTRSAVAQSFKMDFKTPFAESAKKARRAHMGGKPDDVTVCVGIVTF